ncbi:hypothetical protein ACLB2K_042355 [Fragaria x ananassa]
MGSTMKPTIFNERVATALRNWHHTAKKHIKQNKGSITPMSSRPGTPSHHASPIHLLRHYRSKVDSFHTSPRRSNFDVEQRYETDSPSPSHHLHIDGSFSHQHHVELGNVEHDRMEVNERSLQNGRFFRPETAQGIFVNFTDMYYDNGCKLPFAAAQVGKAFQNEISPRQCLLKVREFILAEIEHFVDPENKSHLKFSSIVDNETLGYFLGRVYLFLTRLGIDKNRLRFRQHLAKEMAHYAADCWDAEIDTSYGWIECVVHVHKLLFSLSATPQQKSSSRLEAHEQLPEPREVEKLVVSPVKKNIGLAFRKEQNNVLEALEAMNEEEISKMKSELDSKGEVDFFVCTLGKHVSITSNMVTISKCTVLPLLQNQQFEGFAKDISKSLTAAGISHKMDTTGTSIGKRYARIDELGVPFAITVDSKSSVTIRERDSKDQIRVSAKKAASVMKELSEGLRTWEDVWWSPSQRWKRFWHSDFLLRFIPSRNYSYCSDWFTY